MLSKGSTLTTVSAWQGSHGSFTLIQWSDVHWGVMTKGARGICVPTLSVLRAGGLLSYKKCSGPLALEAVVGRHMRFQVEGSGELLT